jgi:endonuclease/exonuclease/phosphatase family metal-dependent hydrolase
MRLATWNVFHGRSPADLRMDEGRLTAAVASLDADVLGLQEVDRGQARSGHLDLTAVAADAVGAVDARFVPTLIGEPGLSWRPATAADAGATTDAYGIALVSRSPVESWHVLRLPPVPGVRVPIAVPGAVLWLRDEPRVVLAARVRTPAGGLTVATTHLSFVPGANVRQLRRAARWLATLPGPVALLGDLNVPAALADRAPGMRVLVRARTHPAARPRRQLDHVLGSAGLPRVLGGGARTLPLSDHRALWVDLAER